jgi:hypothetical protein
VDALAEHGLMPGHDPYSVPIATVAGTISTNGVVWATEQGLMALWETRWWHWKRSCPMAGS